MRQNNFGLHHKTIFLCFLFLLGFSELVAQNIQDSTKTDSLDRRLMTVKEIFILGNNKTLPQIITREMSLKKGDTVSVYRLESLLAKDKSRIYNTNLFNTVELQHMIMSETEVSLLVTLTERWYFYPIPFFKISAGYRNFKNWWVNGDHKLSKANYGLKLAQYNVRGRDETLLLTTQFGFENVFLLDYTFPYIDKDQKIGLEILTGYAQYKNMPYQTVNHQPQFIQSQKQQKKVFTTKLTFGYRSGFYENHYLTTGFRTANISDSVAVLNPNYFGSDQTKQQYFSIGYKYNFDKRDNQTFPLKGQSLNVGITKAGIGIFGDLDAWIGTLNYQRYFDLGHRFYLGSALKGHISTKNVPYNYYSSLGSLTYLIRGYELYLIEGYRAMLTKNSLKYELVNTAFKLKQAAMPIDQFQRVPFKVYAKLFFDAGYVTNYDNYEQNKLLTDQWIYSIGAGFDIVTLHDVTLRFEQSYNAQSQWNFNFGFLHDL